MTTVTPILANALDFAFKQATIEGKICIGALLILSMFSWTIMISKGRQIMRARKMSKKFFAAYRASRDPLEIKRAGQEFDGAPSFDLYDVGADELKYQLENNSIEINGEKRITRAAFESVKVTLERLAGEQAMGLEKGMIVLSTAVSGGPFIGLLGTVWGVMETFSGIAKAGAATLSAMAPGVAGALIATVVGLFVAIPAMFAYNFMVTTIRMITQELDGFASEYATAIEHRYVDNRALSQEISDALRNSETGRGHTDNGAPEAGELAGTADQMTRA
jgi:biopolymer transport protein ExbB/TolQ